MERLVSPAHAAFAERHRITESAEGGTLACLLNLCMVNFDRDAASWRMAAILATSLYRYDVDFDIQILRTPEDFGTLNVPARSKTQKDQEGGKLQGLCGSEMVSNAFVNHVVKTYAEYAQNGPNYMNPSRPTHYPEYRTRFPGYGMYIYPDDPKLRNHEVNLYQDEPGTYDAFRASLTAEELEDAGSGAPEICVAELRGVNHSFTASVFVQTSPKYGKHVYLDIWCNRQNDQGESVYKGLGSVLFAKLLATAYAREYKRIVLTVGVKDTEASISARKTYAKLGFRKIQTLSEINVPKKDYPDVSTVPLSLPGNLLGYNRAIYDVLVLECTDPDVFSRIAALCEFL